MVEGASRGQGFTVGEATNRIQIRSCCFNEPHICIWEEGGAGHLISDCFANLAPMHGVFLKIGRPSGSIYLANEVEAPEAKAMVYFDHAVTTTAVNLSFRDNWWAGRNTPFMLFHPFTDPVRVVVYNLTIDGDIVSTSTVQGAILHASPQIGGVLRVVCTYAYDANAGKRPLFYSDYPAPTEEVSGPTMVDIQVNDSAGAFHGLRGFGTVKPQAHIDQRIYSGSQPVHLVRDGSYTHLEHWVPTPQRQEFYTRNTSSDSGRSDYGEYRVQEWRSILQNGMPESVAALYVAENVHGLVEARVVVTRFNGRHEGGAWILRQRSYRAIGGNVMLLGSLTVEYADADAGFAAPELEVDVVTQTVRVKCLPRTDEHVHYEVILSMTRVGN